MTKIFIVRIDDIHHEGLHLETQWDIDCLDEILDDKPETLTFRSPLTLTLDFALSGGKVVLNGSFTGRIELACVRCLREFQISLATRFRYILWPLNKEGHEAEKELQQDDIEVMNYEGDHIDLRGLVREQIYLNLPQYPHCSENCRGLCPDCGANLNEQSCSCACSGNKEKGSPFSVLKKLKKSSII